MGHHEAPQDVERALLHRVRRERDQGLSRQTEQREDLGHTILDAGLREARSSGCAESVWCFDVPQSQGVPYEVDQQEVRRGARVRGAASFEDSGAVLREHPAKLQQEA